ncbi:DsrH/TusB family sulfur metabolism protein [Alishewanella sp. d11]|uniref:DsrH/TusB family sulfur metabolism protein n=1 Tax=Alishewanella sp. d11 TaxID=3414030 RepID=UPI003BF847A4
MKLFNLINPSANIAELAALASSEDLLLLRQDAVFLAYQADLPFPGKIVALETDVQWRQITLPPYIEPISASQWVRLSASAAQSILWR